jgi:1-acyl-sn-glycerol-3-phosphate acyltransferase
MFIVPLYSLVQDRTPPGRRSRVIAANNVVNALFMVVAAGTVAILLELKATIPEIFAILAAMNAAVAIYIYALVPEFFLRFIAWIVARLLYSLRATGLEKIPASGPCVLACNHVSFVDWLIVFAAVRRPVRFVMYYKFAKGGLVGLLFRQAKVIPIASAKEDPEVLDRAFAAIERALKRGEVICIFPEGGITRDGELAPFRPGIERIVRDTPVPVIPVALVGLWQSVFSRNPEAKRKRNFPWHLWMPVELRVADPVPAERATAALLRGDVASLMAPPANAADCS